MKTGIQSDFNAIFKIDKENTDKVNIEEKDILTAPKEEVKEDKEEKPQPTPKQADPTKDTPDAKAKEENKKEEVKKEEDFKEKLDKAKEGSSELVDFVKEQISSGEWEDFEVEVSEGEYVKLSEMGVLTKDELKQVYAEQQKIRQEEFAKAHINVSNASESRRVLAEILLEGTDEDIRALKENPELAYEPYSKEQGWDLDNVDHRYTIYIQELQKDNGLSEKKAIALAKIAFEEGDLDQAVEAIVEKRRAEYLETLEKRKEEILEEKKAKETQTAEYGKALTEIYKTRGMKDPEIKKLVTMATNNEIDDLFEKIKQNPEEASDLILFLSDKEAFLNQFEFKARAKANAEHALVLRRVSESNRGTSKGKDSTPSSGGKGFRFQL